MAPGDMNLRLFHGLAAELERGRLMAERLEDEVMSRVAAREADAALIAEAQTLDVLRQQLEVLSGFAARLAQGVAVEAALDGVVLGDVATRLRTAMFGDAGTRHGTGPGMAADAGDFLFFDDEPA